MSEFNPSKTNVIDCERSMNDLISKKEALVLTKQDIELNLSMLRTRVRSARFLPPHEYASICKKQDQLKKQKAEIESNIAAVKNELRKKSILKDEIQLHLKDNKVVEDEPSVKKRLILLRDEYMKFSADTTRIASMRSMAGKVASEIQEIIKSI